nr:MAG TPA: hypothetical protein [Caudoviricetes sp.]
MPFPLLFCSTSGTCNCLATREMATVLICLNAKQLQ